MSGFGREDGLASPAAPRDRGAARDQGSHSRSAEARLEEAAGLAARRSGSTWSRRVAFRLRDLRRRRRCSARARWSSSPTAARMAEAELVVVDAAVTPIQQRNLEKAIAGQGDRPHRADPRDLRRAGGDRRRAACRSSSRISTIRQGGWCGRGPTSSGSAAASASWAAPARRRSRPTAG